MSLYLREINKIYYTFEIKPPSPGINTKSFDKYIILARLMVN